MVPTGAFSMKCVFLLQNVFSYYRMCSSGDGAA